MQDAFAAIKSNLDIKAVFSAYGVEISSRNKAKCPLHAGGKERTPSLKIYPESNSWYCYGCSAGGSAIDFVMLCYGVDELAAARRIDADFGLGLFRDELSAEDRRKLLRQAKQRQADQRAIAEFEEKMRRAYQILTDCRQLLAHDIKAFAPKSAGELDNPHPRFEAACHWLEYVGHLVDELMFANDDEKLAFDVNFRKEVEEFAKYVRICTGGTAA